MNKSQFKFGQWVEVDAYLVRYTEYKNPGERGGNYRKWSRKQYPQPTRGIFLGARNYWNGQMQTNAYPEDGDYFEPHEKLAGALFCPKTGKPRPVLLSDVHPIEPSEEEKAALKDLIRLLREG